MRLHFPHVMLSVVSVYSMDLRRKVTAALDDGEAVAAVARRFAVDPKTVRSWRRRHAAGSLEPRRGGNPGRHPRLGEAGLALLRREVERRPGVTLRELAAMLQVAVAESTVCRALIKMGLRYKKRLWRPANA